MVFILTNFLLTTFMSPRMLHADSMWSNSLSGSHPITEIPAAVPTNRHSPFSLKSFESLLKRSYKYVFSTVKTPFLPECNIFNGVPIKWTISIRSRNQLLTF